MKNNSKIAEIYSNQKFVKKYSQNIGDISSQNFYERLELLKLFPELKNKKVLDAGCGPGVYLDWLSKQGAKVTGLDFSEEMLRTAQTKINEEIRLVQGDITKDLIFNNQEFDIILCSMVLLHIEDWNKTFSEFNRILQEEGTLIFSTAHPFADISEEQNYFETSLVEEEWYGYDITMPSYRHSLTSIFKFIKSNGFRIEEILEPKPIAKDEFSNLPWFIIFSLKKLGAV